MISIVNYGLGNGWSSFDCTASIVENSPSVLILLNTCLTLSGCWRPLSIMFALPKSTSIRSVPAETKVRREAINTVPLLIFGQGTSTSCVSPFERRCRICFNRYFLA